LVSAYTKTYILSCGSVPLGRMQINCSSSNPK